MIHPTGNIHIPDGWKLQELRASVLTDLKEFIPKNFYANVHSNSDSDLKDSELVKHIWLNNAKNPQLSPRQVAAIELLDAISMLAIAKDYVPQDVAADNAAGITLDSIQKTQLHSLQTAWARYAAYFNAGEIRALSSTIDSKPNTGNATSDGKPEQTIPKEKQSHEADWIPAAKVLADSIYKREIAAGCDPNKRYLAKAIEDEFAKQGMLTEKDKRLNAEYILRYGLKGWNRPKK